jgi:cyclohexyl-isocyanide hydratase
MSGATTQIGLLFFPRLTQLDLTGPSEALARLPNAAVLLSKSHQPVTSDVGLRSLPTAALESSPSLNGSTFRAGRA